MVIMTKLFSIFYNNGLIKLQSVKILLHLTCLVLLMVGCERNKPQQESIVSSNVSESNPIEQIQETVPPIVAAARSQIGKTITYDPAYTSLSYPGGDVPIEKGVCTDVVIRALRDALNMDLQKLVHEDMSIAFSKYPDIWGLKKPDPNIDHRRVLNLMTYFTRQGYSLKVTQDKKNYLAGDLVTCSVQNRPHIIIVSNRKGPDGTPFVIHNIGRGTQEENRLFEFPLTGHYRINSFN